jgi:hypothetical protein
MSDDSVPQPYPNIKLAQYAFQLQDPSLSHLHEAASKAFWEGVEKDGECVTGRELQEDAVGLETWQYWTVS